MFAGEPFNAMSAVYHYVIVRTDLPAGVAAAMIVHAAGETGPAPENTRAVVLGVPDEKALLVLGALIGSHGPGVPWKTVGETEGPYAEQVMAIGLRPTTREELPRKVLGRLTSLKRYDGPAEPALTEQTFNQR